MACKCVLFECYAFIKWLVFGGLDAFSSRRSHLAILSPILLASVVSPEMSTGNPWEGVEMWFFKGMWTIQRVGQLNEGEAFSDTWTGVDQTTNQNFLSGENPGAQARCPECFSEWADRTQKSGPTNGTRTPTQAAKKGSARTWTEREVPVTKDQLSSKTFEPSLMSNIQTQIHHP